MINESEKSKVIKDALMKFPNTPSLSIAKAIYKKNKEWKKPLFCVFFHWVSVKRKNFFESQSFPTQRGGA